MEWYYPTSALFNGILSALYLIYVLASNRKLLLNRVFSFLAFNVSFWNITYFIWLLSSNSQDALFWARILMIGPIFIPSAFFHVTCILLNLHLKKKNIIIFVYSQSLILFLTNFTPLFIKTVEQKLFFKYWPVPGMAFHFHIIMFIYVVIYSLYLLFKHYNYQSQIVKNQIKFISISAVISFSAGTMNYYLCYDIPIPPYGNAIISFYIAFTGYAIVKYRLIDIKIVLTRGLTLTAIYISLFVIPITTVFLGEQYFKKILGEKWWVSLFITSGILIYTGNIIYNYIRARSEEKNLKEQKEYNEQLRTSSHEMILIQDIDLLQDKLIKTLFQSMKVEHIALFFFQDDTKTFNATASIGKNSNIYNNMILEMNHPLIEQLNQHQDCLVSCKFKEYKLKEYKITDEILETIEKIKAEVIVPILIYDKLSAFIVMGDKSNNQFYTNDDINILLTFANQAALAINNIRTNKALYLSEKKYFDLIESFHEPIFEIDQERNFTYVNKQTAEILGYAKEDLINSNILNYISEKEIASAGITSAFSGKQYKGIELSFIRKDGSLIHGQLYTKNVYKNNKIIGVSGIAVDITEIYQAKKALLENEEKFRTMIERSSEIITILNIDGNIMYQSQSIKNILGYNPDELINNNVMTFIHPDDRKEVQKTFLKIIKKTEPHSIITYRIKHKNGTWHHVESTGSNLLKNLLINGILINTRDITIRKTTENILQKREQRYKSLYDNALVGMLTCDENTITIINSNELGYKLFGFESKEDLIGTTLNDIFINKKEVINLLKELEIKGSINNKEAHLKKIDGTEIWTEISFRIDYDKSIIETVIIDITKRKTAEQYVHDLRFYDQLTGLANSDMFIHRINADYMHNKRNNNNNYMFAIICLGIDGFKKINTVYGREIGDTLLKCISNKLNKSFRGDDMVSRYEGDKFNILFSDLDNQDDILHDIISKTSNIISEESYILDDIHLDVTASLGISVFPNDGETPEEIMKNSEAAMYMAKDQGGSTYCFFDSQMYSNLLNRLEIEKELNRAIIDSEFVTYFQPKVDKIGNVIGMESLIRWESPNRGFVLPNTFIPIAEKNGMIIDIGNIVLLKSCETNQILQSKGYEPLRVAVNLSPVQFNQPDLISTIDNRIRKTGMDPKWLELEITEGSIFSNEETGIKRLNEIHEMGISIAIDDFGTGYSSLSKLKDYPIDTLKIDKSFIENITTNKKSAAIATSIIDLAHSLNFNVVAEGVENNEQLDFLINKGCDQFQGNYFSSPIPIEEFEKKYLKK